MDNETLTCTLSNLNHHNTKGDTGPPVKVYTPLGRENGMSNCLYLASNCEKCASRHLSEFVRSWRVCFPDEGRPRSRHPHRRQHPHQDGLLRGWRRGHTTVSCWASNWQTCWPLYTYITLVYVYCHCKWQYDSTGFSNHAVGFIADGAIVVVCGGKQLGSINHKKCHYYSIEDDAQVSLVLRFLPDGFFI